jgi:glycosyltransferase involved in cell wall biosynthesis
MVEKAYLTRVDGFIFNSRTTRKTVEQTIRSRTCGVVALPAANVHPGSDRAHVCEQRMRQASPLRVLFVGTLVPRKGLLALIEAMRLLPGNICRLDVVGDMTVDPHYAGEAGNRVRRYGLEALVTFHGGVRPSQLGCLYESSHVLAVPSSYEGYGVVYLEAMGFGLPVIAGTRGAAHEIVTHGTNGFLVEPDSPDAIAAALETLALDRDRRVRMSRAALSRARSQPTWEQSMSQARDFMLALTRSKDAVGGSTVMACHKL